MYVDGYAFIYKQHNLQWICLYLQTAQFTMDMPLFTNRTLFITSCPYPCPFPASFLKGEREVD